MLGLASRGWAYGPWFVSAPGKQEKKMEEEA